MSELNEKEEKIAVAIKYDKAEVAPEIIASGRGFVADKIIATANDADVPTYEDNKLAKTLSKLEIGDLIPPELYSVVAEILVYVDNLDRIRSKL